MKKTIKNMIMGLMVLALVFAGPFTSMVSAAESTEATTEVTQPTKPTKPVKPAKVIKTTCSSSGKVKVYFQKSVQYKKDAVSISVKDAAGKDVTASITSKCKKSLTFKVTGAVSGEKYSFTINGIKVKKQTEYGSVTGSFKMKQLKAKVRCSRFGKRISSKGTRVLTLKCNQRVYLKDATVTVKDAAGNTCPATIKKAGKKNILISISGLQKKTSYTITLTGIKTKSEANYGVVTATFKTR